MNKQPFYHSIYYKTIPDIQTKNEIIKIIKKRVPKEFHDAVDCEFGEILFTCYEDKTIEIVNELKKLNLQDLSWNEAEPGDPANLI